MDGSGSGRIQSESERRRKPHSTQHAELVFGKTCDRIANGPHHAQRQVVTAADVVNQCLRERIKKHPVNREVAAFGVFFRTTKLDTAGTSAVEVFTVAAECGNFDLAGRFVRTKHHDNTKAGPDRNCAPPSKDSNDVVRCRRARDIIILRRFPKDLIANATSGPQRLKAFLPQCAYRIHCKSAARIFRLGMQGTQSLLLKGKNIRCREFGEGFQSE